MRILGISFSGAEASVVLSDGVRSFEARMERNAAGGTPGPLVAQVLDQAGVAAAPEAVAVALGPGSYTGIRMALSFAKTFALVRGLPLYAFSDHAVLAALHGKPEETLCVQHGGHGAKLYCSLWRVVEGLPQMVQAPRLCLPAECAPDIAVRCIGDRAHGASTYRWPDASNLVQLAQRAVACGSSPADLLGVEPVLPA